MKTTAISLQQQETFYTKLVQDFMVNEKLTADDNEKKKFIMLCAVNQLDPRKKQVYAVPHTDRETGKKTLTLIVDYHQFIERAEQSGKLSGWTVGMKKDEK